MLLFRALIPVELLSLSVSCMGSFIPSKTDIEPLKATSLNTSNVGVVFDYEVPGTSTRIQFTTLPDRYYIVAPDVWMTLSWGLYSMTKSIAARGGKALAGNDELDYDSESSDLTMKHSDKGPGAMKLTVFSDLLYGVANVVYGHGLHVEVKLDVWDGRLHVGTGWLLNKDHPQARKGKRDLRQLEKQLSER